MFKKLALSAVCGFLFLVMCGIHATAENSMAPTVKTANRWLSLVDSGAYEQSYAVASEQLRNLTNERHWVETLKNARGDLGEVVHRKLLSDTETRELANAVPGTYRIVLYETRFDGHEIRREQVTLQKTGENEWSVVGYFIHP